VSSADQATRAMTCKREKITDGRGSFGPLLSSAGFHVTKIVSLEGKKRGKRTGNKLAFFPALTAGVQRKEESSLSGRETVLYCAVPGRKEREKPLLEPCLGF